MTRVIAALDNSPAARAVLATSGNLAELFDADVEALHVGDDGDGIAFDAASAAGVRLRKVTGPTVPALVEAAASDDVAALVVGTRRLPVGGRPVGATALDVITSLLKPVVVVPPDAVRRSALQRVLVPLEGTASDGARAERNHRAGARRRSRGRSSFTCTTLRRCPPSPISRSTRPVPGGTNSSRATARGASARLTSSCESGGLKRRFSLPPTGPTLI